MSPKLIERAFSLSCLQIRALLFAALIFAALIFTTLASTSPSFAEDKPLADSPNIGGNLVHCDESKAVIDVESRLAKASIISNLFSTKGSIHTELKELSKIGKKGIQEISPPECISSCKGRLNKRAQFLVIPNKLLSDYDDIEICTQLLKKTKESPIGITKKGLTDVDDFAKWFSDTAQGKGKDGAYLYKECPGDCSITYDVLMEFEDADKFNSEISVECGHARDRGDNKYKIKLAYVWICEDSAKASSAKPQ